MYFTFCSTYKPGLFKVDGQDLSIKNNMSLLNSLIQLLHQYSGSDVSAPEMLKGDGSDRKIYRFYGNDKTSWIGVTNPNRKENDAFILLSKHFAHCQIPVPEIYATDLDHDCYILQDLGDTSLADLISNWDLNSQTDKKAIQSAYEKTLYWLPKIQFDGNQGLDYASFCTVNAVLDLKAFQEDLLYFQKSFWHVFAESYPMTSELEKELGQLAQRVADVEQNAFVYRDFQSRNIMWKEDQPYFIDYQSGCYGAIHYDLATLLYASKAGVDDELRAVLIDSYLDALSYKMKPDRDEFIDDLYHFVLIRRLRSLGTYGHLSSQKGKLYFLDAIPKTIREIAHLLKHHPALSSWNALRIMFQHWEQDPHLCSKEWLHSHVEKIRAMS